MERHSLLAANQASRDLLPIRGAHPGGAGRRSACPTLAPARGGDSSHWRPGILLDRATARWRNPHPGESGGTSRRETANHRTVVRGWDSPIGIRGVPGSRWRLTPPAGPGATIDPTPAIVSAIGPIDPPGVRLARKRMIARPGASFAGRVQVGAGWGWPRPCPAGKSIDGLAAGERDHHGSEARREQTQAPSSWHRARRGRRAGGAWSHNRLAARHW